LYSLPPLPDSKIYLFIVWVWLWQTYIQRLELESGCVCVRGFHILYIIVFLTVCYCRHTLSGTICVSSRLILLVMSLLCVVKDVCLFVWNHLYIFHRFCMVLNKLNICILISALFCEKWTKCESIPLSFFGNSYHDWSYCYITDYMP
jgi:hypothetical protein